MALFVWPPQSVNTTGLATEAKQDVTNTKLDTLHSDIGSTNTKLDTLNAKDFATSAKQDTTNTLLSDRLGGSLVPSKFDYIGYTDGGATETFVYKTGGTGGTTVKTIVVTYSDATKAVLVSVAAS